MNRAAKDLCLTTSLFCCFATAAMADACEDTFKAILIDGNGEGAVKIHSIQQIVGGMSSKNYFYRQASGHWMSEMVEPPNMQWTLTYNNVLYTSADKGKSWKKIQEVDSAKNAAIHKDNMTKNAQTARNTKCGQEEFEGKLFDTVEGDYSAIHGFKSESHHKYWLDPDSGYIERAVFHLKSDNFESHTTQTIEKAPDLQLPAPQ